MSMMDEPPACACDLLVSRVEDIGCNAPKSLQTRVSDQQQQIDALLKVKKTTEDLRCPARLHPRGGRGGGGGGAARDNVEVIRGFDHEAPQRKLVAMWASIAPDLKPDVARDVNIACPYVLPSCVAPRRSPRELCSLASGRGRACSKRTSRRTSSATRSEKAARTRRLMIAASMAQSCLPSDKQLETYETVCCRSRSVLFVDHGFCTVKYSPITQATTTAVTCGALSPSMKGIAEHIVMRCSLSKSRCRSCPAIEESEANILRGA